MTSDGAVFADLASVTLGGRSGVVWGLDSADLNANLVKLDAGDAIEMHRNDEVDVLLIVQGGEGSVIVDGQQHVVVDQSVVLIPCGAEREIRAKRRLLYFSIHRRRGGLSVGSER